MPTRRKHSHKPSHKRRKHKRTKRVHRRKQRGGELPPEGPVTIVTNDGHQLVAEMHEHYSVLRLISPTEVSQKNDYIYSFNVRHKNAAEFDLSIEIENKTSYICFLDSSKRAGGIFMSSKNSNVAFLTNDSGVIEMRETTFKIVKGILSTESIEMFNNPGKILSLVNILPPNEVTDDTITFHVVGNILM